MDYNSRANTARTDGDQTVSPDEFRVNFESVPGALGLYVLRIPDGPCKIGMTRNLAARVAKIQTSHPYDLEVLAWFPDRGHEEMAWHHCFDEHRLRGEWFEWVPEIALAIEIAREGGDWTEVAKAPVELLEELAAQGGEVDVEHAKRLYRALLKRWSSERGVKGRVRLPPRANTPPVPKSPGPVPEHRRTISAIVRGGGR